MSNTKSAAYFFMFTKPVSCGAIAGDCEKLAWNDTTMPAKNKMILLTFCTRNRFNKFFSYNIPLRDGEIILEDLDK